jgi:hypothetical protein
MGNPIADLIFSYFDKKSPFIREKMGNIIIERFDQSKEFINLESFCKLFLSNVELFHVFFPTINIQGIETLLQVKMLMDGKYFRLVDKRKSFKIPHFTLNKKFIFSIHNEGSKQKSNKKW